MRNALSHHWPEYLMEAAGLGIFMISACAFATLLEYPGSSVLQALPDPLLRRILMGIAMGLTAIGIIFSPWGKQSGAHINPAITVTFFRLGKIEPAGPGIEFLEYLTPRDGRPMPADERANDLVHWQTMLVASDANAVAQSLRRGKFAFVSPGLVDSLDGKLGFRKGFLVRDPDGHVMQVIEK